MLDVSQSGASATLRIRPKDMKDVEFRFYLDPGSTRAKDDQQQNQALLDAFGLFSKIPNLDAALAAQGDKVNYGQMFIKILRTAGVEDIDQIVTKMTPEEQQAMAGGTGLGQSADAQGGAQANAPKQLVNYKDAPASIQAQMEQADGYQPATLAERLHNEALKNPPKAAPAPAEPKAPAPHPTVVAHGHHFTDPQVAQAAKAMFPAGDGVPGAMEIPPA